MSDAAPAQDDRLDVWEKRTRRHALVYEYGYAQSRESYAFRKAITQREHKRRNRQPYEQGRYSPVQAGSVSWDSKTAGIHHCPKMRFWHARLLACQVANARYEDPSEPALRKKAYTQIRARHGVRYAVKYVTAPWTARWQNHHVPGTSCPLLPTGVEGYFRSSDFLGLRTNQGAVNHAYSYQIGVSVCSTVLGWALPSASL